MLDAVWDEQQGKVSTVFIKRGTKQIVCRAMIKHKNLKRDIPEIRFSDEDLVGCKKELLMFKEPIYLVFSFIDGETLWTRFDTDLVKVIEANKDVNGFPDIPIQYFQKMGQPIPTHPPYQAVPRPLPPPPADIKQQWDWNDLKT